MIRLEAVSTLNLIKNWPNQQEKEMLIRNKILDYQKLKEWIELHPDLKTSGLNGILMSTEWELAKDNKTTKNLLIYTTKGYSDDALEYTDEHTMSSQLLLDNPIFLQITDYNLIKKLSIHELKHYLSHTNERGSNLFMAYSKNRYQNKIEDILKLISLYEEQVINQSLETDQRGINLFTFNQEKKQKIVLEVIYDVIEYFLENTEEFIWGPLTEFQRQQLIDAKQKQSQDENSVFYNLIHIITNYTTLSELNADFIKNKTLDKFIIKKKIKKKKWKYY